MSPKNRRSTKPPSSVDVARHAGVSQAAVSRAFAKNGSISEETRAKVVAAAAELGYQPSIIPRILLTHRSYLVAIAIGGMYNPFNSSLLEQFTRKLQALGYQVILVHIERGDSLESVMSRLAGYRVDAVFVARGVLDASAAQALERFRIPIISFHVPLQSTWVSSVCCDNITAGQQIADLFVARGATRFGFIGGQPAVAATQERLSGFRRRLSKRRQAAPVVALASHSYEGGQAAARQLLSRRNRPDAVFCTNDLIGIGCLDTARAMKIDVPQDLLVAGFDDIPEAGWDGNSLTTFGQAYPTMVDASIALLAKLTSDPPPDEGSKIVVPVSLVERNSTLRKGPPPK